MKTCTKCGESKPLDHFQRDKSKQDGRRPRCKSCTAEYQASRADSLREYVAEWRSRNPGYGARWAVENKDRHNATQRAYYQRHKDEILRRHKPYQKAWLQANKHLSAAARARRRARERQAQPQWANDTVIAFLYATRQYLSEVTEQEWHVDHVVPLQGANVCGLHIHSNLRVVPADVNRSKGNKFSLT